MAPTNILRADAPRPAEGSARKSRAAGTQLVLRVGRTVLRLRVKATPTAARIVQQLPLYGVAEVWGTGAVHVETPVETGREADARQNVRKGEIAYWAEQDRIIIGFAMTPLSRQGEIRMPLPVNIWAESLDDVSVLALVQPGERVALLHADS